MTGSATNPESSIHRISSYYWIPMAVGTASRMTEGSINSRPSRFGRTIVHGIGFVNSSPAGNMAMRLWYGRAKRRFRCQRPPVPLTVICARAAAQISRGLPAVRLVEAL
jgi:hypothetical protein